MRRLTLSLLGCALVASCSPTEANQLPPGVDAALSTRDKDGDGYSPAQGDCDDDDSSVNPGMTELADNGKDDDCNGITDAAFDGDGFTVENGDCNDADSSVYPHAQEDGGSGTGMPDGKDNDCDGLTDNHLNTTDDDGDEFTEAEGDCDDDDPNANPGAYDVAGNERDEDCNGVPDDATEVCDQDLTYDDFDPINAAKAIGLCRRASLDGKDWGVVDARWITADGGAPFVDADFHLGHGILDGFGPNVPVRQGAKMLVISSGTARRPTDPGYRSPSGFDKGYITDTAWSYQPSSPACPGVETGEPHDSIGLEVTLRVPTNARSATFDFNFFTFEFPVYICSEYNDYFLALLDPTPAGQTTPNVSFDSAGNPISVNNALLQVCSPAQEAGGIWFDCPLGNSQLQGTGFENHAATGWLVTTIPVDPTVNDRIIKIFFVTWDSGDGVLDSTIAIDNWQWSADPATGPITEPVG
jgi:hypothetical protein